MNNRVIKVRAWDGIGKQMMFSGLHDKVWYTESTDGICIRSKHQDDIKMSNMLFTGLHDKNGVEIYEGDVIAIHGEKPEYNAVVSWVDDTGSFACYLASDKNKDIYCDHLYGAQFATVIGNIHENPELLESKS